MKAPAVLLACALALSACTSTETHVIPNSGLLKIQRFYVEHRLTDDHHIDDTIVAELKAMGKVASAGPLTMMPEDAQAVVRYEDAWEWDFKAYLIGLQITIYRARTDVPLGESHLEQPTPLPKPPAAVVREILVKIFKKAGA